MTYNLIIESLNNEILDLADSGSLDIRKLHSLLEKRIDKLREIGSSSGNSVFEMGTSDGDKMVFWLGGNGQLCMKYRDFEISEKTSAREATCVLNVIDKIMKTEGTTFSFLCPELFAKKLNDSEKGDILKFGNSYFFVSEKNSVYITLHTVYSGNIRDFSFDMINREDDEVQLFLDMKKGLNANFMQQAYNMLIQKNTLKHRYTEVKRVTGKNVQAVVDELKNKARSHDFVKILIGKESLGVTVNNAGEYCWYKNNELTTEEFAFKALGYAEATTAEFFVDGEKASRPSNELISSVLLLAESRNFHEMVDKLVSYSKSSPISLFVDGYEKDENGNYISNTFVFSENGIFRIGYKNNDYNSDKIPLGEVSHKDMVDFFEKKYNHEFGVIANKVFDAYPDFVEKAKVPGSKENKLFTGIMNRELKEKIVNDNSFSDLDEKTDALVRNFLSGASDPHVTKEEDNLFEL